MTCPGESSEDEKNSIKLAQAVKRFRENLPAMLELETLNATATFAKYAALIKAGFTAEQSLFLIKKD